MENQNQQKPIQVQNKPIFIPRAVSIEEMLNIINDKLDYLLSIIAGDKK